MQNAKRNVEKYYSVIGVLEEMDITLKVLENYIPRFFTGANQVYYGKYQYQFIFTLNTVFRYVISSFF